MQLLEAQQAESYKSTINHEMRTPIQTVLIVLEEVLQVLKKSNSAELISYRGDLFKQL